MKDKKILKIAKAEADELKKLLEVDCIVSCRIEEMDNATQDGEDLKIIKVAYDGEELGHMIGNRGRHLNSLQFILSLILRKKFGEEEKIITHVDVGGYREQLIEQLEKLALEKADDARILGESIDMVPMSPSDRRIVHMVLKKFDDIETESEGEGWERYVKIIPKTEDELGIGLKDEEDADEASGEASE